MIPGTGVPTLDLAYESKWWLLLPPAFPTEQDADVSAWAERVAGQYASTPPWDAAPYATQLPEFLVKQYDAITPDRTAALWYCPFGLPAVGYVLVTLTERPDGADLGFESMVRGLSSRIDFELLPVETPALGEGVGYSRIRTGDPEAGKPDYAETTYLFLPGKSLVAVTARSADPAVLGLMGSELWDIVESITIHE